MCRIMAPDDSGARGGLVTKSRLVLLATENSEFSVASAQRGCDSARRTRDTTVRPRAPGSQMEALSPIPPPLPNDDEDVSWALSTAGALWGRGERSEALKWLRRAAEQASDANADARALELFKAAAEVTSKVSASAAPPPQTPTPSPPAQAAPAYTPPQ